MLPLFQTFFSFAHEAGAKTLTVLQSNANRLQNNFLLWVVPSNLNVVESKETINCCTQLLQWCQSCTDKLLSIIDGSPHTKHDILFNLVEVHGRCSGPIVSTRWTRDRTNPTRALTRAIALCVLWFSDLITLDTLLSVSFFTQVCKRIRANWMVKATPRWERGRLEILLVPTLGLPTPRQKKTLGYTGSGRFPLSTAPLRPWRPSWTKSKCSALL